jgi:hypothetical protein
VATGPIAVPSNFSANWNVTDSANDSGSPASGGGMKLDFPGTAISRTAVWTPTVQPSTTAMTVGEDGMVGRQVMFNAQLGMTGCVRCTSPRGSLAAGANHTCVLGSDGWVSCWGRSDKGQLGQGTGSSGGCPSACQPGPQSLYSLSGALAIAAGGDTTCAVMSDSSYSLACWGDNTNGQVGNGTPGGHVDNPSFVIDSVGGGTLQNVTAVAVGKSHVCALKSSGSVFCWGDNAFGQVGNGAYGAPEATPSLVSGLANAVSVAAGDSFSCALLFNGQIKCWGNNIYGQLGDGTQTEAHQPQSSVAMPGPATTAVAIAAGDAHACAILTDYSLKCWGNNDFNQLGIPGPGISTSPVGPALGAFSAVAAGTSHTCALATDGKTITCFGSDGFGYGPNGAPLGSNLDAHAVVAGGSHTCLLLPSAPYGEVQCFGQGAYGELGTGVGSMNFAGAWPVSMSAALESCGTLTILAQ